MPAAVLPFAQKAQSELPTTGDYHHASVDTVSATADEQTTPTDSRATYSSGSALYAFMSLIMVHFIQ